MGKRIGIGEAPDATLGEVGVQQLIPILEVGNLTERTPKKTSISAMAAFFDGGGTTTTAQIQRFQRPFTTNVIVIMPTGTARGESSPSYKLDIIKRDATPIAGDENYYTVVNGNIVFSVAGTYRIKGAFYSAQFGEDLVYNPAVLNIFSPAFIKVISLSGQLTGQSFVGATQIAGSGSFSYNVVFCQFDEYITITTAGGSLQFNAQVTNEGTSTTIEENSWTFGNNFFGTIPSITIENLR